MAPDDEPSADVVVLAGPTDDGEGIRVIRSRDQRLESGEVRPLKEGRPLGSGEVVRLAPRPGSPRVCDVEVLANVAPPGRTNGPPKVASTAYRASWDRIFGHSELN
jgi:hypothetical protein